MTGPLQIRTVAELLGTRTDAVSPEAVATVEPIVRDVRDRGEAALRDYAERFDELTPDSPLFLGPAVLEAAFDELSQDDRARLERAAARIRDFAQAQLESLAPVSQPIPGGRAGHSLAPVERVGCYAPGGRYPLPSSVLMTVVPARVAGVASVWVASPKPLPITLAAASIAQANGVLAAGGAHAIASLAYGAGPVTPSDTVVGPGNKYVTAAKFLVSSHVRIDQFAGPSELVVVADRWTDPALVAADLLAQAEHDPDALPILVTLDGELLVAVNAEIERQLSDLPTAEIARAALCNGGAVVAASTNEAVRACDRIAPEHLAVLTRDSDEIAQRVRHYGALFLGAGAGEVLGDYGAGPNHVLPTGGSARSNGGLSVLTFLRIRTWMEITDRHAGQPLVEDAAWFGRLEGLEAHARSAERRRLEPQTRRPD